MVRRGQVHGKWGSLGALALLAALVLAACGKSPSVAETTAPAGAPAPPVAPLGSAGLETRNTSRLGGTDAAIDAAAVARVVYPGLTQASRPATVVVVNESNWAGALAASALAGSPLKAPLLYEQGSSPGELPAVSAGALKAMRPRGSWRLEGAQVVAVGPASLPAGYRSTRVGGAEPFALAAAVARLLETVRGGASNRVIITNPEGQRALAMPAAGLAAESGAPILFATATSLPAATRHALEQMKRPAIYVVGPPSTIGGRVIGALRRLGRVVKRLPGGKEPVTGAIALAEFEKAGFGWGVVEPGHGLVFLNAGRPLDAPAAAPLSATGEYGPALLLEQAGQIPPALVRYLSYIQPGYASAPEYEPVRGVYNHGWLIGGEGAITAKVQVELDDLLEIAPRKTSETSATTTG